MVRVFNPMEANFSQHLSLLESMAQLREEWTDSVKRSIGIFTAYREQKISDSAELVAELIADTLSYVESLTIAGEEATAREKEQVLERYKRHLRNLEERTHRKIAEVWNHSHLEKGASIPLFQEMDLFSRESASLFGLGKREMMLTGAAGGALTGSGVDLMLGGSSMMLGSAIGAVIGGAGALLGFSEIAEMRVLGQKLGSRRIEAGPMQNRNFPYILLRRALYYTQELANRPHADRSRIEMEDEALLGREWIDDGRKKKLEKLHQTFRNGSTVREKRLGHYSETIETILSEKIEH